LEQDLASKVKENIHCSMKLAEKEDKILRLTNDLMSKDLKLKHQHEELTALGRVKCVSDKYHRENAARDQERITKLKRQINKLKRKRDAKKGHLSKARQKKMRNMVTPLRGGGKKRNKKSSKKKHSPTTSVASSYQPKKNTGAQAYHNFSVEDGPRYYNNMMDCGSEYKQMDGDDVSQLSYQSYSGAYYKSGGGRSAKIYGEDLLPDLPPEDVESTVDGHSVSGYGFASPYDSQSMYQDVAYSSHNAPAYGYDGNSYMPYGNNTLYNF